jgi:hypothetical protein
MNGRGQMEVRSGEIGPQRSSTAVKSSGDQLGNPDQRWESRRGRIVSGRARSSRCRQRGHRRDYGAGRCQENQGMPHAALPLKPVLTGSSPSLHFEGSILDPDPLARSC